MSELYLFWTNLTLQFTVGLNMFRLSEYASIKSFF